MKEVIQAVEKVTGRKVPFTLGPRREGDPPSLIANSNRLKSALGWQPRYTSLEEIVSSAWRFANRA